MGAVNEVTDATFEDVVLKSDKPVMVDYWADWCGPCKQVAPIIEELANTYGDKVTFVKMDTNTNPVTPANNHVLACRRSRCTPAASWSRRSRAPSRSRCCSRRSRNTSDPRRLTTWAPGPAPGPGVDSDAWWPRRSTWRRGPRRQRVSPLGDLGRDDVAQAGGKAANLGELVRAGVPVPPGFVVTTAAYRAYVAANDLQDRIIASVPGADADRARTKPLPARSRTCSPPARCPTSWPPRSPRPTAS